MTRQEKYPETSTFHYHNENPKNRITGDCVVRALARATEIPYNQVVMALAELHCKTGYESTDKRTIDAFLKSQGWIMQRQPRKADGKKYTGEEFCKIFKTSRAVAMIGGHHTVAIVNGKVNDIWDSTDGCIGNYWVKR